MDGISDKDKNINTIEIGPTEKEIDDKKETVQNISAQGKTVGKDDKSRILTKKVKTERQERRRAGITGEKQQSYI